MTSYRFAVIQKRFYECGAEQNKTSSIILPNVKNAPKLIWGAFLQIVR